MGAPHQGREHASGAPRAPTARDCLADVEALEPCMGWDGLDEIRVQLRGLRTQTFVDLPFRHHRPEGGRELTSLHQGEALGRASWYMGYRPTYIALRALYRARREPAALAMLWGYAAAAARAALRAARTRGWSARCASASGSASRCGAARRRPDSAPAAALGRRARAPEVDHVVARPSRAGSPRWQACARRARPGARIARASRRR